jgi:amino acid transporter
MSILWTPVPVNLIKVLFLLASSILLTICLIASVAELVSAYPTSGGLYYTISRLISVEWTPSISWIVGWLNLLGQVAGVASSEYGSAQLLLSAVAIGSGQIILDDGSISYNYVPATGHIIGVMAALTVFCGFVNSLSTYWMEKVTKTYVIFHVLVLVTCAISLLAVTPKEYRHDASYAFGDVHSTSGWTPVGWAWLFGFLSVSWTMTDYDATAHIAEE